MLAKGPVWGQKSTKWTSRVVANKGSSLLEVGLLRARAQTKVGEVRDPKGLFRTLPSLRKNTLRVPQPIRYSQTLPQLTAISQIFPNNTTYHLMVPKLTEIHRISPDQPRCYQKPPNERKTHAKTSNSQTKAQYLHHQPYETTDPRHRQGQGHLHERPGRPRSPRFHRP